MKNLGEFMKADTNADIMSEMVSSTQFKQIERFADNLFKHLNIDVQFTKHFKDRTNDTRNKPDITGQELIDFFKAAFVKQGKHIASLGDGLQGILNDVHGNLNLPFTLQWDDRNQELDLVAKTIMRNKNFLSHGQRIMRF
jgi:hypothetical protein